jgi:hypothetical protein
MGMIPIIPEGEKSLILVNFKKFRQIVIVTVPEGCEVFWPSMGGQAIVFFKMNRTFLSMTEVI